MQSLDCKGFVHQDRKLTEFEYDETFIMARVFVYFI